ncbi:MAG: hypothetical protein IJ061_00110 [Lachnospiraceae bacterium]|nr:hypothetical protein [Lachnospiraceae bacterium]
MERKNLKKAAFCLVVVMISLGLAGQIKSYARTTNGQCNYSSCNKLCYVSCVYYKDKHPTYKNRKIKCYVRECNNYTDYGCGSYCRYHHDQKFGKQSSKKKTGSSQKSTSSRKKYSYQNSYDDGYEDIYLNYDYDDERYRRDSEYANGVDDAMDDEDW